MNDCVIYLSIPGLRRQDLASMPQLRALTSGGDITTLVPSFPAVTWTSQTAMLTGKLPNETGVIGNGFFWRDSGKVEMWTAWNDKIQQPQIWDVLHKHDPQLTSATWFPMLTKGCGADYICMPAPVHNPDGSESLWCYTKPVELYGELRDGLGHFPLMNFWGPMAGIASTAWIANSAAIAMQKFKPRFFHIYLPQLDYAAQKLGPDSPAAAAAVVELDNVIGKLAADAAAAYQGDRLLWLVAGEYAITPVNHVTYPNRVLREAGLLTVTDTPDGELIPYSETPAWALVDHQFSHVFVKDADSANIAKIVDLFKGKPGIAEVLAGDERKKYGMDHERSGEVLLISTAESWQAYYYWLDDAKAPKFARTVDIHRKPGYDPVELHFDRANKCIPLDATLIGGSHGAPANTDAQRTVLLSSQRGVFVERPIADTDLFELILNQFGI